ncbi:hypothetical protein [Streptomyces mirabilis]|uniref:hypothetical protein n=1 Tax=Streptomyces mirabilis TaxID=68239 RepID=UPI0036AF22F3
MPTPRREPDGTGRCQGTAHTTGERCKRRSIPGGAVCKLHGGATPNARRAAAERLATARARTYVGKLKIEATEDPIAELQKIAGESVAIKDYLRTQVETLTSIRYRAETEQTRAELTCYLAALRDCTSVLTSLARLNLDERAVRIKESQANMIKTAVDRALREGGVEGESLERARQAVGRHLRVIKSV